MRVHLRAWRAHKGLSQSGLAKRAGVSKSEISRLENGSRRFTTDWLQKLADAFGVDPESLFSDPHGPSGSHIDAAVARTRALPTVTDTSDASAAIDEAPFSLTSSKPNYRIFVIVGDEMMPTLGNGDAVIVDNKQVSAIPSGLFLIEEMGVPVVRRVQISPAAGGARVTSDNKLYEAYEPAAGALIILGRVVARISSM